MNTSKTDISKKEPEKPIKPKKNIREIYLQAINSNKAYKKSSKKKGISNLSFEERNGSIGSSNFLEKEYSLVQRIIADTKELKHIKNKNENKGNEIVQNSKLVAAKYKTQEQYYDEILELKKALKILENNEVLNKAKLEYYETELLKKEQEIIDLLDVKKAEEFRLIADSKSDLGTLVYGLKQKIYKLDFLLKRKENELNKLKNELKTTNMKELKLQNERLRVELSKALMSDTKILEPSDIDGKSKDEKNDSSPPNKRETELLDKIARLEQIIKELINEKEGQNGKKRPETPEEISKKNKAIGILQDVMKGHIERRKILRIVEDKPPKKSPSPIPSPHHRPKSPYSRSPSPQRSPPPRNPRPPRRPLEEPDRERSRSASRRRSMSPTFYDPKYLKRPPSEHSFRRSESSESDNSRRTLIREKNREREMERDRERERYLNDRYENNERKRRQDKNQIQDESENEKDKQEKKDNDPQPEGCCSPWLKRKNKNETKNKNK